MIIPNISNYPTKYEFFKWWDSLDKTQVSSREFLLYHLTHCHFHGKTTEETVAVLKKAFPPIINTTKLCNGRKSYDSLESYIQSLQWVTPEHFDINQETCKHVRQTCVQIIRSERWV